MPSVMGAGAAGADPTSAAASLAALQEGGRADMGLLPAAAAAANAAAAAWLAATVISGT
jgi:hypothetical protein